LQQFNRQYSKVSSLEITDLSLKVLEINTVYWPMMMLYCCFLKQSQDSAYPIIRH